MMMLNTICIILKVPSCVMLYHHQYVIRTIYVIRNSKATYCQIAVVLKMLGEAREIPATPPPILIRLDRP